MPESRWSLYLHGGARDIGPGEEDPHYRGLSGALASGRAILMAGGTALYAGERTVRALKDDSIFNTGSGAASLSGEGEAGNPSSGKKSQCKDSCFVH